jgi:hypothetical protein
MRQVGRGPVGQGRVGTGQVGTGIGQVIDRAAKGWAAMGRQGQVGRGGDRLGQNGPVGDGSVGIRSVGNGLVAKKVAADPPSFNWFTFFLSAATLAAADHGFTCPPRFMSVCVLVVCVVCCVLERTKI